MSFVCPNFRYLRYDAAVPTLSVRRRLPAFTCRRSNSPWRPAPADTLSLSARAATPSLPARAAPTPAFSCFRCWSPGCSARVQPCSHRSHRSPADLLQPFVSAGKISECFYWHGRDNVTNRELNPKTLSSGLDDYPRASHPSDEERHLDLRCWMLLAADCMHSVAELLGITDGSDKMHLDDSSGAYFDFGNHSEKVRLRWHEVKISDVIQRELLRETLEVPQLGLVPHFGYVSLFPFMMGIIPSDSWILEKQLDFISNSSLLWTKYGLRSLSRTSSIYMKRNTEYDPPYWRGPIWININYLILSALHHYAQVDGPYTERARKLYES